MFPNRHNSTRRASTWHPRPQEMHCRGTKLSPKCSPTAPEVHSGNGSTPKMFPNRHNSPHGAPTTAPAEHHNSTRRAPQQHPQSTTTAPTAHSLRTHEHVRGRRCIPLEFQLKSVVCRLYVCRENLKELLMGSNLM